MGWRFHKSINFGGVRVNMSKSGMGLSVGSKGFRVAYMPDGRIRHTMTIPGTGLSYSEDVSPKKQVSEGEGVYESWTGVVEESGYDEVSQHYEEACKELFENINAWKTKKGICYALFLAFACLTFLTKAIWLMLPAIMGVVVALVVAVHPPLPLEIDYNFTSEPNIYTKIEKFFAEIEGCQKIFHIRGANVGVRRRTHGGANQSLYMDRCFVVKAPEHIIKSNVECFCVKIRGIDIFVLPDITIIVRGRKNIKVINTASIKVKYSVKDMVWEDSIPRDTKIKKMTWKYVNNDGSPDRRFKDNRQIPICEFGALEIENSNGLHFILYGSDVERMKSAYETVNK